MSNIFVPPDPFDPVDPFDPFPPFDPFDPVDPFDPDVPDGPFPPFDPDDLFPPFDPPPPENPIEPFFIRPSPDGGIEIGVDLLNLFRRFTTNNADGESIFSRSSANDTTDSESSLVIEGINSDEGLLTTLSGSVIETEPEDTDGDGIPDTESRTGLDFNEDGEIDLEVKEIDLDEDSLIERVEITIDTNFDGEADQSFGINTNFSSSTENDFVLATSSSDEINLEDGDDIIFGDKGNDFLSGDKGNDSLFGNKGNDSLNGGSGEDTISGNEGSDIICGGLGNDLVFGNKGKDFLFGGIGNDFVSGGIGNDFVSGGIGNDFVSGDQGNDFLFGSVGNDTLVGGLGKDTFQFEDITPGEIDIIDDFTPGKDKIRIASSETLFEEGSLIYNIETGILSYDPDGIANNGDELDFLQIGEDLDIDIDDFEFL